MELIHELPVDLFNSHGAEFCSSHVTMPKSHPQEVLAIESEVLPFFHLPITCIETFKNEIYT